MVRESQRRRFADVAVVDEIIELDHEWKAGNTDCCAVPQMSCVWSGYQMTYLLLTATSYMETLKMQRNALNKQIGEKRKVSSRESTQHGSTAVR